MVNTEKVCKMGQTAQACEGTRPVKCSRGIHWVGVTFSRKTLATEELVAYLRGRLQSNMKRYRPQLIFRQEVA